MSSTKRRLVIQMDDPHSFNPNTDSTLALALEAQGRDYEIYYYRPNQIGVMEGKVIAQAKPIQFFDRSKSFYEYGDVETIDLETADVILIRQNPPYNMEYLGCTWLLERLQKPKVYNRPASIRNRPEKLFPLEFEQYIPPTCISADTEVLRRFREAHPDTVMKPLYGFGGASIFRFTPESENFNPALELLMATTNGKEPVILQAFLPQVMQEEKRILLIDGELAVAYNRVPAQGEIRSNGARGGSAQKTELTPRQREIATAVGGLCKTEGLMLVGLDVIGDYLIEINTTCPTGLRVVEGLYGLNLAAQFWDAVEAA